MSTTKVHFKSRGIVVVGELYRPAESAPDRKRAAIVVGHPGGGVKEQTAGLHAKKLAEAGFYALAFDAAYQGESEGEPRGLEDPTQRAEDVRAAVTYLSTIDVIDRERIGALGICASGGYVSFAAQTDVRIKAVATVSAVDVGELFTERFKGTGIEVDAAGLYKLLKASGDARNDEAMGKEPPTLTFVPDEPKQVPDGVPTLYREGTDYYRTPRGQHPRSTNRWLVRSADLMANYRSYTFNHLISPRPYLAIAGSKADTRYFSEDAVEKARSPKELFIVEGKTHIQLYDDFSGHIEKLIDFFAKNLTQES
jgi:uncharacterized protein